MIQLSNRLYATKVKFMRAKTLAARINVWVEWCKLIDERDKLQSDVCKAAKVYEL